MSKNSTSDVPATATDTVRPDPGPGLTPGELHTSSRTRHMLHSTRPSNSTTTCLSGVAAAAAVVRTSFASNFSGGRGHGSGGGGYPRGRGGAVGTKQCAISSCQALLHSFAFVNICFFIIRKTVLAFANC
jgi:hypothetical protein